MFGVLGGCLAARDARQAAGTGNLGVVDVPSVDLTLGPVEPPVTPPLQVGRQLLTRRPVADPTLVVTPIQTSTLL